MAISLVQTAVNASSSNASTLVLTFGSNITAGSMIFVCEDNYYSNGVSSITDGPGDSPFVAIQSSPITFNGSYQVGSWYFLNSAGGSKTVTLNLVGTGHYISAIAQEWSGIATSSALDGSNHGVYGSSPIATGSITTTNGNDVLIAVAGMASSAATLTSTGSWVTAINEGSGSSSVGLQSQIVSSTGTYSGGGTTGTYSSLSLIAAFQAAAGGGGATTGIVGQFLITRI
jgi:hypothetical protein